MVIAEDKKVRYNEILKMVESTPPGSDVEGLTQRFSYFYYLAYKSPDERRNWREGQAILASAIDNCNDEKFFVLLNRRLQNTASDFHLDDQLRAWGMALDSYAIQLWKKW